LSNLEAIGALVLKGAFVEAVAQIGQAEKAPVVVAVETEHLTRQGYGPLNSGRSLQR